MRWLIPTIAFGLLIAGGGCSALEGLTGGDDDIPLPTDQPVATAACTLPDAPKCSEHGRCRDTSGTAKCECDQGWTGPTCTECAIGGPCIGAPTCAETKCAAHSTCELKAGAPSCACVVGYKQADKDCVWGGVIRDPSFQNQPAGSWTPSGDTVINPTLAATKDPGAVELQTAQCAKGGVSQKFTMPSYASAEPLAFTVYAKAVCTISVFGTFNFPCIRPISMALADSAGVVRGIEPFPSIFNEVPPAHVCLGDGAYGSEMTLSMFSTTCGGLSQSTLIDYVDIAPANDCPTPGQLLNSDFESNGGWVASGTGAEVAAGVGDKSSRGGRLHNAKRCDGPRLSGAVSVRSASAKPSLTFTVKGTLNRKMHVYAGFFPIATIVGTAVYDKVSICLPDHMKGVAGPISFALDDDSVGGACGDADDYEFVFDDVKTETDASCEDPAPIVDGGFERTDAARYWAKSENGGVVSFPKVAASAHAGLGYASIIQSACSKSTSMRASVTVPSAAPGSGGPAVELFYKASTANNTTYSGPAGALAPTTTWTRSFKCLEPRRSGFPSSVDFSVNAAGSCGFAQLLIDDVRATHDPSCPEQ